MNVAESSFKELIKDMETFAAIHVRSSIIETLKNITHQRKAPSGVYAELRELAPIVAIANSRGVNIEFTLKGTKEVVQEFLYLFGEYDKTVLPFADHISTRIKDAEKRITKH